MHRDYIPQSHIIMKWVVHSLDIESPAAIKLFCSLRMSLGLLLLLSFPLMFLGRCDYAIDVRVQSYRNPTGRCAHEQSMCTPGPGTYRCCDDRPGDCSLVCNERLRCDNIFTYCLMQSTNVMSTSTRVCAVSEHRQRTTVTNWNDKNIDFTNSMVLGLPSVIRLRGLSAAWEGALLHVMVEDNDTRKADDLVDIVTIPISGSVEVGQETGQETGPAMYSGVYGLVEVGLSFSVNCLSGFYGPFCNVSCPIGSNCSSCLPGFTGIFCQTEINECAGAMCGVNGHCVNQVGSFLCICNPGYVGPTCNMTDHCHGNPCANGLCTNTEDTFECECDPGFVGRHCVEFDHCSNHSCNSSTQCISTASGFICQCEPGYTGESCDLDIDDCSGVVCPGNLHCKDDTNSYMCICPDGSREANCSTLTPDDQQASTEPAIMIMSAAPNKTGWVIGGIAGGMVVLVLAAFLAVLLLVAARRRQRTVSISGKTVLMAGDNPIYALDSDIISISVPPSKNTAKRDYVNMFLPDTVPPASKQVDNYETVEVTEHIDSSKQTDTPDAMATREMPRVDGVNALTRADTSDSTVGNCYENIRLWEKADVSSTPPPT